MIANSQESLQRAIGTIRSEWNAHHYLKITVVSGKKRSLDANALSHLWYAQISRELGEDTPEDVHCECKLRFAVPILRAEDAEFRAFYDQAIKQALSYSEKLAAMRFLPATRLMTREQMGRYLTDVQRDYARRGVLLESLEAA